MELIALEPARLEHRQAVAEIWNAACGPDLAISAQAVDYNLRGAPGLAQQGWLAVEDGWAQGMVIASRLAGHVQVMPESTGWIDAIGVMPSVQRQGIGSALLAAAERWLAGLGCIATVLGGSIRPFAPGLPDGTGAEQYFRTQGYRGDSKVHDLARNLAGYTPPAGLAEVPAAVRPAQRGQEEALLGFLRREFPGRWLYEAELLLHHDKGRIGDYMLLWTEQGVDGCCLLTFPDSMRPLERYFPYSLPRPWGQLGAVGVSERLRRRGFGGVLVDAGLRRLHDNGINGCVIDWTELVNFYGRFGFAVVRSYWPLGKGLGA